MMFRPKYCCNCGEKIEREEWRFWTSRRFCALCSTEYRHIDLFPIIFVGLGAFLTLLGLGTYFGSTRNDGVEKAQVQTNVAKQLKPATLYSGTSANTSVQIQTSSSGNSNIDLPKTSAPQNIEQPTRKPNTSEVAVFYCGAVTKKGTPCTRRVKSKGYCWQHAKTGQIAPTRF